MKIFEMPKLGEGQTLHIILEVQDNGSPSLTSYRRIVLGSDDILILFTEHHE